MFVTFLFAVILLTDTNLFCLFVFFCLVYVDRSILLCKLAIAFCFDTLICFILYYLTLIIFEDIDVGEV